LNIVNKITALPIWRYMQSLDRKRRLLMQSTWTI